MVVRTTPQTAWKIAITPRIFCECAPHRAYPTFIQVRIHMRNIMYVGVRPAYAGYQYTTGVMLLRNT
jgi:hypothetical protein